MTKEAAVLLVSIASLKVKTTLEVVEIPEAPSMGTVETIVGWALACATTSRNVITASRPNQRAPAVQIELNRIIIAWFSSLGTT
jgi:hypothetical protein